MPDKNNVHLLIVDEQLFQPYIYVSVTLYLHFYVVNPTSGIFVYTGVTVDNSHQGGYPSHRDDSHRASATSESSRHTQGLLQQSRPS